MFFELCICKNNFGGKFKFVGYSCKQCDHKATSKGDLAKHKRSVHEGVKYPCEQCDHKATSKGDLAQHKKVESC